MSPSSILTDESGRTIIPFDTSSISIGVELETIILNLAPHKDHFTILRTALTLPTLGPFIIKDDFSITPTDPNGRRAEIATPIMTPSTYPTIIPAMCTAIVTSLASSGASVAFNASTALQVHIGLGDGNTYALTDLKRICKAIIVFEKQMDTLHPNCRNPPNDAVPNFLHCCRGSFRLKLLSEAKKVDVIDKQMSTQGVVMVINSSVGMKELPKYYKYNFRSLEKFGTIEFRQAVGTIRSEVIIKWIDTVIKFVTAAVETEDRVYEEWAAGTVVITDSDYERFGVPLIRVDQDIDSYWGIKESSG